MIRQGAGGAGASLMAESMASVSKETVLLKALRQPHALPQSGPLLVACSGGVDSMSLCEALSIIAPERLRIATVDHQLHAHSSELAYRCTQYWRARGFPCWSLIADHQIIAAGEGIEDGARRARYHALDQLMEREGISALLTAHHANDQGETILMRLGSGAGLRGLCGIAAQRGRIWRPWLECSRAEIERFAKARALPLFEDPTNQSFGPLRNRIRPIVTALCASEPSWLPGLVKTTAHLQESASLLSWFLEKYRDEQLFTGSDFVMIQGPKEGPRALTRALLKAALEHAYIRWGGSDQRRIADQIDLLEGLLYGIKLQRRSLPFGLCAEGGAGVLLIAPPVRTLQDMVCITGPGTWCWGGWTLEIEVTRAAHRSWGGGAHWSTLASAADLSRSAAPFPWSLAHPPEGARFRPAGLGGEKRVRRLWGDRKVP
ncbi:MAG: tRNA lysidine(34) synthetase TilS, partial [Myxococcota bacterium]|nr:tRNA lysidine(34) synthetase TilS [Myxococcota bacterium]